MGSAEPRTAHEWIERNWPRLVVAPQDLPRWKPGDSDAPRSAGVYFLWAGETGLDYIGCSGDVLYRLAQHRWAGRIAFDSFSVIEVDPNPFPFDLCAPTIERAYIEALEPPLNTLKAATTLRTMVMEIRRAWVPTDGPSAR